MRQYPRPFRMRVRTDVVVDGVADVKADAMADAVTETAANAEAEVSVDPPDTVLVVGGGGREHALIKALSTSPDVGLIYALPGNGGIAEFATCVPIKATDVEAIAQFAVDNDVDFAVVAPDDPLVLGAVDALEQVGIPAFGPNAKAALIEGSKSFAKDLMLRYGIPTADYQVFTEVAPALAHLEQVSYPIVVKADGLALGKGVVIAQTEEEAAQAVTEMLSGERFGSAGKRVVIEEFLSGPEVTVLAFTDGETLVPMISSMDHKRIFDGDRGPNTGGMGVIAPNPFYTDEVAQVAQDTIFSPTVQAMVKEGRPFKGCLYFGLILTDEGPKVIEYNCRFGDPETQAILPLLETDLFTVLKAVQQETLADVPVTFSEDCACTVVVASNGYPESSSSGEVITITGLGDDDHLYHAGTALTDQGLVTSGGRVLAVTSTAPTLPAAVKKAYEAVGRVSFPGAQLRSDIGMAALNHLRSQTNDLTQ